MKRITFYTPTGEFGIDGVDLSKLGEKLYGAVTKLKDYENTGLSPSEVEDMKYEVEDLRDEFHGSKWVSTDEALPSDGEAVLAIVNGKPRKNITLVQAYELAEFAIDSGWIIEQYPEWENAEVTHWMPLPEPPTKRSK